MVHGFKGFKDWAFFPHLCRSLAAAGHAVISFNFSGSGIGTQPEKFTELEAFAANTLSREVEEVGWVVEWVMAGDLLPSNPVSLGLIGHSRGGGDAILHASGDPRVKALVTWSAVSTFERWSSEKQAEWREAGRIHVLNSRTGQQMPMDVGMLDDLQRNRANLDVVVRSRKGGRSLADPAWRFRPYGGARGRPSVGERCKLRATAGGCGCGSHL